MTIYLTIITTVLVLTQIIRLIQNALQLRRNKAVLDTNLRIENLWSKIEKAVDLYLEQEVSHE